jgi:hypothetical protein
MRDGDKVATVRVSEEALQDGECSPTGRMDYLEAFERQRASIEQAASRKYDAGQKETDLARWLMVEPNGQVIVKTADLI